MILKTTIQRLLFFLIVVFAIVLGVIYISTNAFGAANTSTAATESNLNQPYADGNGLVAWYTLDGNTTDSSGNSNNGTLHNFTLDGTTNGWVPGKYGEGLLLNGLITGGSSDEYVDIPHSTSINNLTQYSENVWVFYQAVSGAGNYIVDKNNSLRIALGTNGAVTVSSAFSGSYGQWYTTGTGSGITNGIWNDIAVTYDRSSASNVPTIYVNGVAQSLVDQYTPTGTLSSDASTDLTLGNIGNGSYIRTFNGIIDDFRLYNRILSQSEVTALYQGSRPPTCDQTCVSYLKFDDDIGTTAADSSGNSNTGTVHGTNTWTNGDFGSALLLNGTSGYVSLPNLGLTGGTVEMWINPTTITGNQTLFSQLTGASTQAGSIMLNGSSGASGALYLWNGTAYVQLAPASSILAGVWNQIVVENNGNTATAFVNGVQQSTVSSGGFAFSGVTSSIGDKFLGTTGSFFSGTVDEFRVYSRYLSPEEVTNQWQLGS